MAGVGYAMRDGKMRLEFFMGEERCIQGFL